MKKEINDINIQINNKKIDLTFEEGEVLLEQLYLFFKDQGEDYYAWEKSEGIPDVTGVLDYILDWQEEIEWWNGDITSKDV